MRDKIFKEIEIERIYQEERWGVDFDNKNNINDWVSYINTYTGQASKITSDKAEQRRQLLKAVTIGIAALERFDDNDGFPPRHYE